MSEAVLQKISEDLDVLKERIGKIEDNLEEISVDIHREIKPEYVEKLQEISEGPFLSEEEFEKELG